VIEEILRRSNPWWAGEYKSPGVLRTIYLDEVNRLLEHEKFVILFGLRRVGKTTIMRQIIAEHLKNIEPTHVLFASMDHSELEKTPTYELLREFRRINGLKSREKVILFLDEIQSRPGFEKDPPNGAS
jgi:predicted AAA+ superfamily ATPase